MPPLAQIGERTGEVLVTLCDRPRRGGVIAGARRARPAAAGVRGDAFSPFLFLSGDGELVRHARAPGGIAGMGMRRGPARPPSCSYANSLCKWEGGRRISHSAECDYERDRRWRRLALR